MKSDSRSTAWLFTLYAEDNLGKSWPSTTRPALVRVASLAEIKPKLKPVA